MKALLFFVIMTIFYCSNSEDIYNNSYEVSSIGEITTNNESSSSSSGSAIDAAAAFHQVVVLQF